MSPFPCAPMQTCGAAVRSGSESADGAAWGAGDLQPRRQLHHSGPAIPSVRTSITLQVVRYGVPRPVRADELATAPVAARAPIGVPGGHADSQRSTALAISWTVPDLPKLPLKEN